jgi:hypothetical protein
LEKLIHSYLIEQGYEVEFHKEQALQNNKLQLDLYLPRLALAIEVDGPAHTKPIWGQDALDKSRRSEHIKNGQIIGLGMKLIRIRSAKNLTKGFIRKITSELLSKVQGIEQGQITDSITYIGE